MEFLQNNYDPVASYYDVLSRLVFGRAEIDAQVCLLGNLSTGDRILVIGGGTGWILAEMALIQPHGLKITYVESSGKMMSKAKRRTCGKNEVSYVLAPVEQFQTDERYDYILTGFFFDNFSTEHSHFIFQQLDVLLKRKGFWCFADFSCSKETNPLWQRVLLQSMYISARFLCHVEAAFLPDTEPLFELAGYKQLLTRQFYYGMIKSILYQKK
jgi:ubiquinone/menaquinone biosynthesis C-methylase UbiE